MKGDGFLLGAEFRGMTTIAGIGPNHWAYGSLLQRDTDKNNPMGGPIRNIYEIVEYNSGDWNMGSWVPVEVDPTTVGRYIGVIDKNNRKIFEGDVVNHINNTTGDVIRSGVVEYSKGGFGISLFDKWVDDTLFFTFWEMINTTDTSLEVVGNKFGMEIPASPYNNPIRKRVVKHYAGDIMPDPDTIFVFGSNPEGRHGAGAAKVAREKFGAIYGQGEGLQGNSYAIPTKDLRIKVNNGYQSIPPIVIIKNIEKMYKTAKSLPNKKFMVAYRNIGDEKSLNGYSGNDMITMFLAAAPFGIPDNVYFSEEWINTGRFDV